MCTCVSYMYVYVCDITCCRSHILQADSEADYHAWMNAIQAGVSTAYNNHQRADKVGYEHDSCVIPWTNPKKACDNLFL